MSLAEIELHDLMRVVNLTLGIYALIQAGRAIHTWQAETNPGYRILAQSLAVLIVVVISQTLDQLTAGVPGGWRTPVTAVGLTLAVLGMHTVLKDQTPRKETPDD